MTESNNTPEYINKELELMAPSIRTCRDVHGGQDSLRIKKYLPQFEGESNTGYKERVSQSYLNNKFNDKISISVGLVTGKGVTYSDDTPEYLINDVDNIGSTIDQFTKLLLKNGEIDGHDFILVDAPLKAPENKKDQEDNNIHPFWIITKATDVLNWKYDRIKGDTKLVRATVREFITEDDGEFGEKAIEQFKVYKLVNNIVTFTVYQKQDGKKDITVTTEETNTSFTDIPLVPFYANKVSDMVSEPPFLNIANLNVNTFQLGSQKQRALRQIGDPDKAIFDTQLQQSIIASQMDEKKVKESGLTFGADIAQVFSTDADYKYVEPTGKGVELLTVEIAKVESDIDGQGAQINDISNQSATEAEIKNTKATAVDVTFSTNLEDALNKAFEITKQVDTSISSDLMNPFSLNRDFAKNQLDANTITVLNTMTLSGNLSRESLLKSIATGELPKHITDKEIEEEISKLDLVGFDNGNL